METEEIARVFMGQWRCVIDGRGDGFYNMAVDEYLIDYYRQTNQPVFRIYSWKPACISIGYSQNPSDVLIEPCHIDCVRRLTGGSAIFHDDEITYSLCLSPKDLSLPLSIRESYKYLCGFLIEFYRRFNLHAEFAGNNTAKNMKHRGIFCFSSHQPYDLLIAEKKIGGNAQRRSRNIIFQHGSIPRFLDRGKIIQTIKQCGDLIDTAGICECAGKDIPIDELIQGLIKSFSGTFDAALQLRPFTDFEQQTIEQLKQQNHD